MTGFAIFVYDLLAGLVVALSLIPEAIAFSIIAGVDPKIGLYASFCVAAVIAFAGGRPGMISGATGAIALVMVSLVKDHALHVSAGRTAVNRHSSNSRRMVASGSIDAFRVVFGHYLFRQCARDFDLHGATAR